MRSSPRTRPRGSTGCARRCRPWLSIALIAMLFSLRIPTEQPAPEAPEPETAGPGIPVPET